ncbi:trypsin-like peptidase domain-containing protein [Pseudonocardia sp. CA-107938]|uniref:nSTAND1 domain-containing NTPase n=1 Tax=Pseudonocardia sp. CA-107938 TaxID=3240021 RepID=UPI003D8E5580
MLRGEADALAGSAVRVWSRVGEVVGAGFVAGPDTVATCAHVVAEALGADPYAAAPPHGVVRLDLPLLGGRGTPPRVTATVSRWLPIGQDGTGDVALLRVREPLPIGARMPPLRRADEVWGRSFRALGFPDGAWDGVWSSGRLRAGQGTGWVQLQTFAGEQPVVGGFSGSAVWDTKAAAVVGMTVAADRSGTTTAYLVPIDRVLGLDPELLPCPYQGLAPFTEEQAAFFFGRDDEIARLVEAIGKEPIVALAGPSGAGKSSLLRAGLVPRLRRAGAQMVEVLPGASISDFEPDGTDQVLLLDQFEELAARHPQQARRQLEAVVALTRSGPVRAVLTLRGSALDDLLTPGLAKVLNAATLHVAPLDRANLRETIVRPAERAPGLDFEPGLVDRILDDAGSEPGQLPLVESLLVDLWRRREGGRLTWRGYTAAGGVMGAVAQHAERVVSRLAGPRSDEDFHDRLRRLFGLLAAPDAGGRIVRVPVPTAALAPDLRSLVPQLAAGRLLVLGRDTHGAEIVELAHQALIEHWPRLRNWLDQDRAFLAWRAQADQQRMRWEAAGRDDGSLLRGSALVAAGEWLPSRSAEVAPQTRDFIARSTARQRRDVRRSRLVIALLAVLAAVAGLLVVVSEQRGARLADQLRAANADELGRLSTARSDTDPLAAAQLALAAYRADPTNPAARTALGSAYLSLQGAETIVGGFGSSAAIGDVVGDAVLLATPKSGRGVITGAFGSDPQLWKVPDDQSDRPLSLGATWVAVTDGAGGVRIWDLPTRTLRRTVPISGTVRAFARPADDVVTALVDRGSTGFVLVRVDVRTGAAVERALPGAAPTLTQMGLADGRPTMLERFAATPGGSTTGWAVRTLSDDPAKDIETPLPVDARNIEHGLARMGCVQGQPGGPSASVTLEPVHGDIPARTIALTGYDCATAEISVDGGWLVERVAMLPDRDQEVLRLVELSGPGVFQALVPRIRPATLTRKQPLPEVFETSVERRPDGSVMVLQLVGNTVDVGAANVGLLRVRAVPVTADGDQRRRSTDGRWAVFTTAGRGVTVYDRATGAQVSQLPVDLRADNSWTEVDDGVWLEVLDPEGWKLQRLELPSLRVVATYPMPRGQRRGGSAFIGDGDSGARPDDPLVVIADGLMAALDKRTGAALGPTVPLGTTEAEVAAAVQVPYLWARPGHPGQVVVANGLTGIDLWDAVAGRRLGSFPAVATGSEGVAFDVTGRRLAVLTVHGAIEVYDVDTFSRVRDPIVATDVGALIAIGPDGFLVATGNDDFHHNSVLFFDLARGRGAGTFVPGTTVRNLAPRAIRPSMTTGFSKGQAFVELPLLAEDWFSHICGLMDRPYSHAEMLVLPEGTDTSPPCRR